MVKDPPSAPASIILFENPHHQTWLSNIRSLFDPVREKPAAPPSSILDKPIQQRVKVAYNESAFSYSCEGSLMLTVVAHNMANWFGYDSVIVSEQPAIPAGAAARQELQGQQDVNEQIEPDTMVEDTRPDDIEEQKKIVFYFRCDEGSGTQIEDISDNKYKCEFNQARESPWSQDKLEEAQPLEYEDKWGKANQPSYSIDLTTIGTLALNTAINIP